MSCRGVRDVPTESAAAAGHNVVVFPAAAGGTMHGFKGERVLMRVHIDEDDKHQGQPLYKAIIELLRKRHYGGATAFRGIMGFGASATLHTDRFEYLSFNLPVVVECVETEERILEILPVLDEMIGGGLITLERAKVIMYRRHLKEKEDPDDGYPIDITGSWAVVKAPE
jgi:PII-like signaling protein